MKVDDSTWSWQAFLDAFFAPQSSTSWVLHLFLVLLATAGTVFVWRRLHQRAMLRVERSTNPWDDVLWKSLKEPVTWGIWVAGVSVAALVVRADLSPVWVSWLGTLRGVGFVVLLTWFAWRLIGNLEALWLTRAAEGNGHERMDATTATAIAKLLRASTAITAILTLLQTFNVDISAVLAFGGLGGLAVGMAAKDLIANFFGGLTIYLDKPFKVGDWIRSPDRQIEGTVEYIGWRQTRIRTFDKRPLYIPNATFTQIAVENPSRMTHRRIYETFGLRYQDARVLEKVVNEVRDYLRKHDDLATDQTLIVNVNEFADSSVNFFVYCFTKTTDWVTYHRIKEQVLLDILKIIHKHGADVAFPTRTVQIEGSGMAHMAGKQGPEG